jgi:hypothetical protein
VQGTLGPDIGVSTGPVEKHSGQLSKIAYNRAKGLGFLLFYFFSKPTQGWEETHKICHYRMICISIQEPLVG